MDKQRNEVMIKFYNQPAKIACDRQCNKAWVVNSRPRVFLQSREIDPDDFYYLSDGELGEAPIDPGTYEDGEAKPLSPDDFPNKWCIRECERCAMSDVDMWLFPLELLDFSKRMYNKDGENQVIYQEDTK